MSATQQIEEKVKQVLYGGDAYDAAEVFDESEHTRAKRMFGDYAGHPNGDDLVQERAEKAISRLEEVFD